MTCRHLASEIGQVWNEFEDDNKDTKKEKIEGEPKYEKDQLLKLAMAIVPYHMKHNAESEACDLLMELEKIDLLEQFVDKDAYPRVCLYLTR